MSRDQLKEAILSSLRRVAPDIAPEDVGPDTDLRRDLDLDSMDFLNFVVALHQQSGVEVPEADYRRLRTLASATEYLEERLASGRPARP